MLPLEIGGLGAYAWVYVCGVCVCVEGGGGGGVKQVPSF